MTSPLRAGHAPGGTSGDSRPAPVGDHSPRPGPLGWAARSSVGAERYRSGGVRRSPSPSGVADDDRSSAFDTVDFDRDDTFRSVLASSGAFTTWKSRQVSHQLNARLLLHRSMG